MPEIHLDNILLVICVSVFTALAAVSDMRIRKIPNKLTIPVFFLGILYQLIFHQLPGLGDAAAGFGIGFGTLFVLWLIGGGGGGDVKLMGALGVWLGFTMTVAVMVLSTIFVILGTVGVMCYSMFKRGMSRTKAKYFAQSEPAGRKPGVPSAQRDIRDRRIMAYAVPVALATWVVLLRYMVVHAAS